MIATNDIEMKIMKLADIANRKMPPAPWETGEKIPWNDPEFSHRMLENHLSQDHDWASRRLSIIEQHVEWLSKQLPNGKSRILDFGCGPGFYTHRLAKLGHECVGVDFSPASISYARQQAVKDNLSIDYLLADIRECVLEGEFDLIMMTFGEINVFRRSEAENIIARACGLLRKDGLLVIETHAFEEVRRQGQGPSSWQAAEAGLFSDCPHLCLQENFWNEAASTAITRYLIVDVESGDVREYGASSQAYTDAQYLEMLGKTGMGSIRKLSAGEWPVGDAFEEKLQVYACRR